MKTNKELQKGRMKFYAQNKGVEEDMIDFDDYFNSDLSEGEAWDEFREDIDELTETETSDEKDEPESVKDFYSDFIHFLKMVARGFHTAALFNSPPGIGKSYQIRETLDEEVGEDGYVQMSGHASPMEFHKVLAENRDKIIVLDDVEGLVNSKTALSTLKQATWSEDEVRDIQWTSSTNKIDEEYKEFEFSGQVIMVFNEVPDNRLFDSLKDRCLYHELDFTYDQRIKLIYEVAKEADHITDLGKEERLEVAHWIANSTSPAHDGVNLRMLVETLNMREYDSENWKNIATTLLNKRDELARILELQHEYDSVERQAEEFSKSRRTFYRKKRQLEERAGEL